MNPTPTFTQLTAEPNAQPVWWLFPALLGIVFLVWYMQRWLNQRAIKAALDTNKAKAEAEKSKLDAERARIDEAMFSHLPSDASQYARDRLSLHVACLRAERPDLILARAPKTPAKEEVIS